MKIFIALFIILLSTIITNTTYEKDKIVSSYAGDKYPVILHGIISNIKPITNSPIPNKNWEVSIHGVWVIKNSVKLNVDEWKLWEDHSFLIQSPAKSFRSIDKITELINKPVEICFYLPTNNHLNTS